ncbi:MAG: Gfo/Idh/MocA family oxidoreductase [Hyphomonas sp.]|nr:Gfo/Idh/MocA family oxidoreductase [Hyphomonas sp.]
MTDKNTSRRTFLQMTGVGLAASPWLAACATAQSTSIPRRAQGMPWPNWGELPETPPGPPKAGSVGIAVVGLGGYGIGKSLPAVAEAEGTHVAAVVSGNPEKAAKVAAAYGLPDDAIYSYDTFARIAEDDRIEAVYIVLPTGLHAEWTEFAFAAGKHVICEKPMALTPAECERMIAASKRANKKLMIAYRCHFEPYNLKATELMKAGAIGAIQTIETTNCYTVGTATPADDWRLVKALTGGGALEDYGLYGLQATMYLTGETPSKVIGQTEWQTEDPRFTEIPATTRAEIHFPSGAVANLTTSYNMPGSNTVIATGTDGKLIMDPATYYDGNAMKLVKGDAETVLTPGASSVQFSRMVQHFADAIRKDVEIKTPGEMGLRDSKIIQAIYKSAQTGEAVTL